jgi:bacterial leucyl aminopeptidase
MKYLSALLSLASLAAATPLFDNFDNGQTPLTSYPGFSLNLNADRLVEIYGQPPVHMSELEKVKRISGLRLVE